MENKSPYRQGALPKHRCHSVRFPSPIITTIACALIFWLSIITLIILAIYLIVMKGISDPSLKIALLVNAICSLILGIISLFKRRRTVCQLCKGTPFHDNLARKHQKALRIPPLNSSLALQDLTPSGPAVGERLKRLGCGGSAPPAAEPVLRSAVRLELGGRETAAIRGVALGLPQAHGNLTT